MTSPTTTAEQAHDPGPDVAGRLAEPIEDAAREPLKLTKAAGPIRDELPEETRAKARVYAKDLPDDLREEVWRMFIAGLEPLREGNQLGSVLLQYPRWFFTGSEQRDTILEAKERLARDDIRCAV